MLQDIKMWSSEQKEYDRPHWYAKSQIHGCSSKEPNPNLLFVGAWWHHTSESEIKMAVLQATQNIPLAYMIFCPQPCTKYIMTQKLPWSTVGFNKSHMHVKQALAPLLLEDLTSAMKHQPFSQIASMFLVTLGWKKWIQSQCESSIWDQEK